jgi:uncharacterized protein (DUF983 family)
MQQTQQEDRPALWLALRRGLLGRCPNCGHARLFASYLKQVDRCGACGETYQHIRSDDAAPWLTILVVGHVLAPIILSVEPHVAWPLWISMALWPALALGLTFLTLPRAKGFLMSAIWAMRAPGSERD